MSEKVRVPAVAGMFYPADPEELRRMLTGFLDRAAAISLTPPKAIIVPHAGYIYSGPVAATAYAQLHPAGINRVVLIGPSHCVSFPGLAAPEALEWETPLGEILIDFQALEKVVTLSQVQLSDMAHKAEHSLEVQLPFLQSVLDDFQLVPLVAGDTTKEEVAEVLDALWGGPETLVVISSDLCHYESYERASEKDRTTAQAIVDLDTRGLEFDDACGLLPVKGLVHLAQQKLMRAELLDLRNSGDTAGPRDAVVGYGAFAFYE
ncbi:MAG: AmmeMemoRadiSam system protein B [Verrucomicrobia bacterium]|nr:AmmeMemoRadiSam system protein B [Verrucomicrobiota bacterium]